MRRLSNVASVNTTSKEPSWIARKCFILASSLTAFLVSALIVIIAFDVPLELGIQPTSIRDETDAAFIAQLPVTGIMRYFDLVGDDLEKLNSSKLKLYENGKALGPSASGHRIIRDVGKGAYSHWRNHILFSSSDNSNPKKNGRTYSMVIPARLNLLGWAAVIGLLLVLVAIVFLLATKKRCKPELPSYFINSISSLYLIIKHGWVVALTTIALVSIFHLKSSNLEPETLQRLHNKDVSSVIISAQKRRAASLASVKNLLIGDSSCLMGVDLALLNRETRLFDSICTIGFLAPDGYVELLRAHLGARAEAPEKLIIVMHPFSMFYEESWGQWLEIVKNGGRPRTSEKRVVDLELLRNWMNVDVFSKLLQIPMKGPMGLYYGDINNLERVLLDDGQLIDPTTGLHNRYSRLGENSVLESCSKIRGWPNNAYLERLKYLGSSARTSGIRSIMFVVTPMPEQCVAGDRTPLSVKREQLAQALGIEKEDVIYIDKLGDVSMFSSFTHLNRIGRKEFTTELVHVLLPEEI